MSFNYWEKLDELIAKWDAADEEKARRLTAYEEGYRAGVEAGYLAGKAHVTDNGE